MSGLRRIGFLSGLAAAMLALAAPSASAEAPEFGRCVKQAGGHFQNSGCSVPAVPGKETFEWAPGVVEPRFTTKLKEGTVTLERTNESRITCTAESGTGEIAGPKEVVGVVLTFNGCETAPGGGLGVVTTPGQPPGQVVTGQLSGVLGVERVGEAPAKNKLALELHPAPASTFLLAECCAGDSIEVRGSVLLNLAANKMTNLALKASQRHGEQKPDRFAGGIEDEHTLESSGFGGPFEESALGAALLLMGEEPIEASSVN
jgi:hypothetical protein